jgi:RHS repeat-associated protein
MLYYGSFDEVTDHIGPSGSESIHYDEYGRVKSVADADLGTVVTGYDAFDRPTTITQADDSITRYVYDLLDRVVSVTGPSDVERFFYDRDPIGEEQGEEPTENSLGRLVRSQHDTPDGMVERVLRYEPRIGSDDAPDATNRGLLASMALIGDGQQLESNFEYLPATAKLSVHHYPASSAGEFDVRYCYDPQGAVSAVMRGTDCGNTSESLWQRTASFRGVATGAFRFGNGVETTLDLDPDTYTLKGIVVGREGDWSTSFDYQYDEVGRLTHENRSAIDQVVSSDREFHYADSGVLELVESVSSAGEHQSLWDPQFDDALRLHDVAGANGSLGAFAYDAPTEQTSNRPSAIGLNQFRYDGRGNQTFRDGPDIAGGHQDIHYNDSNLPRKVTTGAGASQYDVFFQYDAAGHRAVTRAPDATVLQMDEYYEKEQRQTAGGVEEESRYYVFAEGERIALITRTQNGTGGGFSESTKYLHHDRLGSLIATSDQDGSLGSEIQYGLFGEPSEELDVPYGYTDYRHEQDLGLVDARGRFYDPKFGFFLSADPVGPLSGSSTLGNRYAYVGYDPINRTDPSGLQDAGGNVSQPTACTGEDLALAPYCLTVEVGPPDPDIPGDEPPAVDVSPEPGGPPEQEGPGENPSWGGPMPDDPVGIPGGPNLGPPQPGYVGDGNGPFGGVSVGGPSAVPSEIHELTAGFSSTVLSNQVPGGAAFDVTAAWVLANSNWTSDQKFAFGMGQSAGAVWLLLQGAAEGGGGIATSEFGFGFALAGHGLIVLQNAAASLESGIWLMANSGADGSSGPGGGESPSVRPDVALSGGRSGELVKDLTGPPNSVVRGSGQRAFVTNDKGQVILDITKERVKPVQPGQGFGPKRTPTADELDMLQKVLGGAP